MRAESDWPAAPSPSARLIAGEALTFLGLARIRSAEIDGARASKDLAHRLLRDGLHSPSGAGWASAMKKLEEALP